MITSMPVRARPALVKLARDYLHVSGARYYNQL